MANAADHGLPDRLGSRTWPETERAAASLLIIPLGATEQHGPHLPLNTDTVIAASWAAAVADRLTDAVAAPAIPFGSSGEHQDFPGTLSIGGTALQAVVVELVRSAGSSFERVAFLSGHAGNDESLGRAMAKLRHEGHDVAHFVPTWSTGRFGPIDAHAGRVETSLLLHLRPDLVRLDRAEAGNTEPLSLVIDRLRTNGVAAVSPNGVLGDPTGANASEGQQLFDDLVSRTVEQLSDPPGDRLGHKPTR